MMVLKILSDLLIFISYSMNVLVNFSMNFSPKHKILDIFDLPIEWVYKSLMNLFFMSKGS